MHTSRLIFISNIILVLVSVAGLCLCSSLFDFIVSSKLYYTDPDHRILINPNLAFWLYPCSCLAFLLSFCALLFLSASEKVLNFAVHHQFLLSFVHALLMSASCILSSLVCLWCAHNANDIGQFTYNATPLQFQHASAWYFARLRALAVVSAIQSIVNGIIISVLYLGINCKYRTFVQVANTPIQPDLVERTTYFA